MGHGVLLNVLGFVQLFLLIGMGRGQAATVTSSLPGFFTPGVPLTVTVNAMPDTTTQVYAIEETPPASWVVSEISHGGTFDLRAGTVKWGPFVDAAARVLSYRITPPLGAAGTNRFSGRAAINDVLIPMTGVRATVKFPGTLVRMQAADYLPGTEVLVTLVTTPAADVKTWAVEESVPVDWTVTGISDGGSWDARNHQVKWGPFFDATARSLNYRLGPPVHSQADVVLSAFARFDAATREDSTPLPLHPSQLVRNAPPTYQPGVTFTVSLRATPASYVQTLAMEEAIPVGWEPSTITGGGVWDVANHKLKWGPFFGLDVVPLAYSYQLTPSSNATLPLALRATARFDGAEVDLPHLITRFLVHSTNTVVRTLPLNYHPGQSLTVTLAATPIDTALVYAIEEGVPEGWTIGAISHGGVWDVANRQVKWGPFFDAAATPRTLTYQLMAPADLFGPVSFSGTARFDQSPLPISGDSLLSNAPPSVVRSLPGRYLPGVPFQVALRAAPVPGVLTYAVEETVPDGWVVSGLTDGGAWDARNHVLKWGPFLDQNLRTLVYTVTAPLAATGTNTFAGNARFNAEALTLGGIDAMGQDHPPVAVSDTLELPLTNVFKFLATSLLANDTDADNDFLSVTAVSPKSTKGGEVTLDWPWITYTPPLGFIGTDSFSYTIDDGYGGVATATVTLNPAKPPTQPTVEIVSFDLMNGGTVLLRFTGTPGNVYHLEISSDMVTWSRVTDRIADAAGQFQYEDTNAAAAPVRFYRTVGP
jgi:Bacterial Ig domain